MSDGDNPAPTEDVRSSPLPGCLILSTIVLVFGGLVVLYIVVGLFQTKRIATFTRETPAEIVTLAPTPAQVEMAAGKLKEIEIASTEGSAERFLFTAEDLNVLIASQDTLADFRGTAFVERISPQGLVVKMAQPMRGGIVSKASRYLNGIFVFQPELRARTVAFKVLDIRPEAGEVPEAFIGSYAALDFFRLDPENEAIKEHITAIRSLYTEGEHLVVETGMREGGEPPAR